MHACHQCGAPLERWPFATTSKLFSSPAAGGMHGEVGGEGVSPHSVRRITVGCNRRQPAQRWWGEFDPAGESAILLSSGSSFEVAKGVLHAIEFEVEVVHISNMESFSLEERMNISCLSPLILASSSSVGSEEEM